MQGVVTFIPKADSAGQELFAAGDGEARCIPATRPLFPVPSAVARILLRPHSHQWWDRHPSALVVEACDALLFERKRLTQS